MKTIIRKEADVFVIILIGAVLTFFRSAAVNDFMTAQSYDAVAKAQAGISQLQVYINGFSIAYLLYESIWCKKLYTKQITWRDFIVKHMKIILGELLLCVMVGVALNQWTSILDLVIFQMAVFGFACAAAYVVQKYYAMCELIKHK